MSRIKALTTQLVTLGINLVLVGAVLAATLIAMARDQEQE